jgi:ACS family glucarate transporter-like MFS transporter
VALPNFNRAVADWVPPERRGLGIGIAIAGIGVGAAVTPPLAAWIMVNWGWQVVFYLCSALGLLVAALWMFAAGHQAIRRQVPPCDILPDKNSTSRTASGSVPWRRFGTHAGLRWLVLSYSCLGYVAYVYMSWFYLYLVNVRGFDVLRGGWFASAPFLAILVFCPIGGWMTDRLALQLGVTKGRTVVGMAGMLLAGATIAVGSLAVSPALAIIALLHRRSLLGLHDGPLEDACRDAVRSDEHRRQLRRRDFADLDAVDCRSMGLVGGVGRRSPRRRRWRTDVVQDRSGTNI